jgi:ribosomal protein L16 Arg81 hydroxylase
VWLVPVTQNFTIQLTGRKRWSISPGVFCPVTNHTNPKNIATEKFDVRWLALCAHALTHLIARAD